MCSYKEVGSSRIYKVQSSTKDKKTKYLITVICPEKFKLVHNKEVTELGRTRAGILKPMLDRTLVASQSTKI